MLSFHVIDAYNGIMTAASTRFLGFVEGVESLFFVKPHSNQITLIPDPSKLLLIATTLTQYKSKASATKRQILQYCINLRSNGCIHAILHVLYCVGMQCLKPSMEFCQTATTCNVGLFTYIATVVNSCHFVKANIISQVNKFDSSLIQSVLAIRDQLLDFSCIKNLKNCVMKMVDCNAIQPNNKLKWCTAKRDTNVFVWPAHRQEFDCPKLSAIRSFLPLNINGKHEVLSKYFQNVKYQVRNTDFKQLFHEWFITSQKLTEANIFNFSLLTNQCLTKTVKIF